MINILEFLKNGSGIHIKKKNRGKFTEYCGGTVTDECIRRAKSSGNPTLVKRATFAANARKWKHKEGGIIKADDGTKLTTGQKIGNFFNSNWGSFLTSAASNILNAKQQNDQLSAQRDLFKSQNEETYNDLMQQLLSQYQLNQRNKYNKWIQDYQSGLTNDNPSQIVAQHQAYQQSAPSISNLEKQFKQKNKAIDQQLASQKADTWINTIGSIAQSGLGLLANKKQATSV